MKGNPVTEPLEPCCDCGALPTVRDNSQGTGERCVKWYECACGRKASWKGGGTRTEAAKKWNAQMRFVQSFRKRKENHEHQTIEKNP